MKDAFIYVHFPSMFIDLGCPYSQMASNWRTNKMQVGIRQFS
jgi:hypothetical protein